MEHIEPCDGYEDSLLTGLLDGRTGVLRASINIVLTRYALEDLADIETDFLAALEGFYNDNDDFKTLQRVNWIGVF
jgi:hypothetical protein